MPKKVRQQEVLEEQIQEVPDEVSDEVDDENIVVEPEIPEPNKPKKSSDKPKRVMTDAQKEALAKGRQKGWDKLRERQALAKEKSVVNKQIKQIQEETQVKDVEDLKKIADISGVNKKVEGLYTRFNDIDSKLTEMLEMKKKKHNTEYQRALQDEVKKEARSQIVNKTAGAYNRWLGKI